MARPVRHTNERTKTMGENPQFYLSAINENSKLLAKALEDLKMFSRKEVADNCVGEKGEKWDDL